MNYNIALFEALLNILCDISGEESTSRMANKLLDMDIRSFRDFQRTVEMVAKEFEQENEGDEEEDDVE